MLKHSSVALLAIFGLSSAAAASTINVPADYPTIQAAINAAVNGDTIKVANGTYNEHINLLGKQITLQGQSPFTTILDGNGTGGSMVTMNSGETAATLVTGFLIREGNGRLIGTKRYGGGVYIAGGSDPTLIDCRIGFNTADYGAGLFVDVGSDILVQDCLLANNVTATSGHGGGAYLAGTVTFDNNRVAENTATVGFGGGVYVKNSTTTFTNNQFDTNIAWYGGGLHVQGGSPTITDNLFETNSVVVNPTNGEGAGLSIVAGATPWVSNNEIRLNVAHSGAGIYTYDSSPTIILNNIHSNTAATNGAGGFGYGGGMALGKTKGSILLNEVYFNTGAMGGGVATRSGTSSLVIGNLIDTNDTGAVGLGGGVYSKDSNATLLANTIAANNASKGGGVYAIGTKAPAIDTSIIYFNTAPLNKSFFDGTGGLMTFGFSDVEAAALGGSSLDIDPGFANIGARDYSLLSTSPVIDAGNFAFGGGPTDVYGNPRVSGGRVDMGAVEF
jgi:hypothetical protein